MLYYKSFYLIVLVLLLEMVKVQCKSCPGMFEKGQGIQHHLKKCPGHKRYQVGLQGKHLAAAEVLKKEDRKKRKQEKKKQKDAHTSMTVETVDKGR